MSERAYFRIFYNLLGVSIINGPLSMITVVLNMKKSQSQLMRTDDSCFTLKDKGEKGCSNELDGLLNWIIDDYYTMFLTHRSITKNSALGRS